MRTYSIEEARAALSELIDQALKGEPQRVIGPGTAAVMIVAEAEPTQQPNRTTNLVELFLQYAGEEGYEDVLGHAEKIDAATRPNFGRFLMTYPGGIEIERNTSPMRKVEF